MEDWPELIEDGLAEIDTTGAGVPPTVTDTDFEAVPIEPVQLSAYVEVAVGDMDWIPESVLVPDHAPEAVQLVALVEDHESVEVWPSAIDVGLAERDTVGAVVVFSVDVAPPTVTDAEAEPPAPVQVIL